VQGLFEREAYLMAAFAIGIPLLAILIVIVLPMVMSW